MAEFALTSPVFIAFASISILLIRLTLQWEIWSELVIMALNMTFLWLVSHTINNLAFIVLFAGFVVLISEVRIKLFPDSETLTTGFIIALWLLLFMLKDPDVFLAPFGVVAQNQEVIKIVGVSYFMFRCISYTMDSDVLARRSFIKAVNYLLFFPTVLAGPITRYEDYLDRKVTLTSTHVLESFNRIASGFIKKFVLAEFLSPAGIFAKGDADWSWLLLWVGIPLQLLILYLDFAGYCDIMIGIARLAGFNLPENFNHPFRSKSIQEFWTRWHITLGSFVKDYVFSPIYRSLLIQYHDRDPFLLSIVVYFFTMLLIALWHKVSTGFLIFGLMHASALVLVMLKKHYYRRPLVFSDGVAQLSAQIATYIFVSISMIFWYYGPYESFEIMTKMFTFGVY